MLLSAYIYIYGAYPRRIPLSISYGRFDVTRCSPNAIHDPHSRDQPECLPAHIQRIPQSRQRVFLEVSCALEPGAYASTHTPRALIPISSRVASASPDRILSGAYAAHTPKPPAGLSRSQLRIRAWRIRFDVYPRCIDANISSPDRILSGAYPAHTPKPPAGLSGSPLRIRAWRIRFDAYPQGLDPNIIQRGLLEL